MTSIGDFNDVFDGAVHRYGTEMERDTAAEKEWATIDALSGGFLEHDSFVETAKEHYRTESRLKFRLLEYLGTYVGCFSSKNNSTLMWSHYADSNNGICIEYDFNQLDKNSIHRNMIFPILYSKEPLNLSDLLEDNKGDVYAYPMDAAVLCSALNKSKTWNYENEWRMVLVLALPEVKEHRIPISISLQPNSICFGYHFLRPLFYYDVKNYDEINNAEKRIVLLSELLDFMEKNAIQAKIMIPEIGKYALVPSKIEIGELKCFIKYYFRKCYEDTGMFRQVGVGNKCCPVAVGTIRLSSSG